MTFPSIVKKSGPITISKNKPGSKTSTGSPRSPVSPLNTSIKLISESLVKAPLTNKTTEKTHVESSIKSPLTSKAIEKTNGGSPVKKLSVPLKSSAVKTDAKPEPEKKVVSTTKAETKSVMKPPPLKLNIKSTDSKGLKSPATTKSIPKTPTSPSVKSLKLTKSPVPTKSTLATKSPSLSSGTIKSTSINKISPTPTVSSSVAKSQVTSETKTTSSLEVKSAVVSSPVAKSPSLVSKTSIMTSTVPKSPRISTNLSTSSVKSVSSKDQVTVLKPTTPVKKAVVSSTKNVLGVKLSTTSINKPSVVPRSPTTVSSTKSSSVKIPASPLKLLTKESSIVKVSPSSKSIINKSNVISKPGLTSSKVMVQKESSTLSLISVKSSSTIKSTSAMSKTSSQKAKVVTTSMSVSNSVVPKSPRLSTSSLTVAKTTQSSSTVKTPSSPAVKTSTSSVVKTKTPLTPISKARTLSLSLEKSPLSPTIKKAVPTKLILSPGLPKTKSLSSSRLSSISTESLSSRSSLKSPISPKPTKNVTKILSKVVKKTEEPKTKSIRGGQPLKKTIDIPGITELPSNNVLNKQEILDVECKLENTVQNILKEEIESTPLILLDQDLPHSEELETLINVVKIDNDSEETSDSSKEDILSDTMNTQNFNHSTIIEDNNLQTIEEDSVVEPSSIILLEEQKQDKTLEYCSSLDFVIVRKDDCEPCLSNISQSLNNCDIVIDDNHFGTADGNVILNESIATESFILDIEDNFEPMNDKLILGDVPFETDSSQSDISDNEQIVQKEIIENENNNLIEKNCIDDVFLFTEHDLSLNNFNRTDSTDTFIEQFMPQSINRSEGASSISTDDGSLLSRKSYSEVVSGSPKDNEYYYDYDIDMVDDCLEYEDEEKTVFVEVTEKEFPELKPKDLSGKRRKNKKQRNRNFSYRTGSQSDSNISENDYDPENFDGNEFCHYIKMMKDCSFYPNGLFSSDTVKLSTSSSLSWLDISVRTTDDDLIPSTESLSTYEVFQASNLNRDFLMSIIGSTSTMSSTNETSWFWKSIEGRHQPHNKANITLSLKPGPKHLTTPRFMTLLALISEAKGYDIKPSLSEHFETTQCMSRFDNKIRRLMVQGFWLVGRLIKESLSGDEKVNCGNPFKFVDGDIGFWWAGINMLDWQEYIKENEKTQKLINCYEFVVQNMSEKRHNFKKAELSMNASEPDDFMSELDMSNFIHTVRNVKYYSGNCFVDSEEHNEEIVEACDDDNFTGWENNSDEQH